MSIESRSLPALENQGKTVLNYESAIRNSALEECYKYRRRNSVSRSGQDVPSSLKREDVEGGSLPWGFLGNLRLSSASTMNFSRYSENDRPSADLSLLIYDKEIIKLSVPQTFQNCICDQQVRADAQKTLVRA